MEGHVSTATAQGLRPYQEDQFLAAPLRNGWLLAVMDGHSGATAAENVGRSLKKIFLKELQTKSRSPEETLRRTVAACARLTRQEPSGTTLSIAYLPKNEPAVYTVVIGDSPIVVVDVKGRTWVSPE